MFSDRGVLQSLPTPSALLTFFAETSLKKSMKLLPENLSKYNDGRQGPNKHGSCLCFNIIKCRLYSSAQVFIQH